MLTPALVPFAATATPADLARYPAWLHFNIETVQALPAAALGALGEQAEHQAK